MKSELNANALLGDVLVQALRQVVREEVRAVIGMRNNKAVDKVEKPYLTVKDAASASGLAVSTLRVYIRKRELRAQRVGRRVLIKKTDLENFLDANPIEALRE